MMNEAAGIVLAGGRSSRMGKPKAWLPLNCRTLLEAVLDAVRGGLESAGAHRPILVVVGAPGQDLPPLARGVLLVRDEVPEEGPLRGLAAGLEALSGLAERAYVSSCDAPLLRPGFVARMLALADGYDIAVPVHEGRHHPLAAVYRTSVLPEVRALLDASRRRPFFLFERVRTREVGAGEWADVDSGSESLRNANTPEEYLELVGPHGVEPNPGAERRSEGSGARDHAIIFELYGTVRTRARRDEVEVRGTTLGEAIAALELACPPLAGLLVASGRLAPHYRLSVNGREFVSDPARRLAPGDRLILLPAAAGG